MTEVNYWKSSGNQNSTQRFLANGDYKVVINNLQRSTKYIFNVTYELNNQTLVRELSDVIPDYNPPFNVTVSFYNETTVTVRWATSSVAIAT